MGKARGRVREIKRKKNKESEMDGKSIDKYIDVKRLIYGMFTSNCNGYRSEHFQTSLTSVMIHMRSRH